MSSRKSNALKLQNRAKSTQRSTVSCLGKPVNVCNAIARRTYEDIPREWETILNKDYLRNSPPFSTIFPETKLIILGKDSTYTASWYTGTVIRDNNITSSMTQNEINEYIAYNYASKDTPIWTLYNTTVYPLSSRPAIFMKVPVGKEAVLADNTIRYGSERLDTSYLVYYKNDVL